MRIFLVALSMAILLASVTAFPAESMRQDEELLRGAYHRNLAGLSHNSFGLPLVLESVAQKGRVKVDVYGSFDFDFESIAEALQDQSNWCDILSLTPNVKACTYQGEQDDWRLTLYLGRKRYQAPQETYPFVYRARKIVRRQGYLDIELWADTGPFGTRDHRIGLAAMPLNGNRTFVHVKGAYRSSAVLRLAEKIYFATLGAGKVGFTVIGTNGSGDPIHIGGPRGAIERNAMRTYLAIQAFMSARHYPAAGVFPIRASTWYDLSDRYRLQLFELEKEDYLVIKSNERKSQEKLQREIDKAPP
ncbi:MAG: hypothetical protein SCI25_09235 [Desulfuromonadales bacterium]|nr:hypothetical protein [Desulfuromonadales bacterium]MDW7758188.1 hypothetical protein [Desulfuromonadales bacterium]